MCTAGLIVLRGERTDLYIDVAEIAKEYLREQKNKILRWTVIDILNRTIDNSPREAVQEGKEINSSFVWQFIPCTKR